MTPIYGTQTLTQQAYAALKRMQPKLTSDVFYFLANDDHTVEVWADQLRLLAQALAIPTRMTSLEPTLDGFTAGLSLLAERTPGIYVLTPQTYLDLGKNLALLESYRQKLRLGAQLSPKQIKERLEELGFEQDELSAYGYKAKGGTVTIRQGDESYRVVIGETGIEEIVRVETNERHETLTLLPQRLPTDEIPERLSAVPSGVFIHSDQIKLPAVSHPLDEVVFRTFRDESAGGVAAFGFTPSTKYDRDFARLAADIKRWQQQHYHLVFAVVDTNVLTQALRKEQVLTEDLSLYEQASAMEGFVDEAHRFILFTHADVFGRRKLKEKGRRDDSAFITSLQINDYVVHENHGIGRYLGLVKSEIEGHARENLLIEYAKGDRLYVPVELAYKVDRYVGEAKPKLHRLAGTNWIRLSRKASQDSQQFAKELLKMYAQRSLVRTDAWLMAPDADRQLHESFGYQETPDQEQAIQDVYRDLGEPQPMDRLVVGDVGFGKTEVAIRAAYQAVLNHKQVVVLCPTTLLAQQHFDTFSERLGKLGVRIQMLSRFSGKTEKTEAAASVVKKTKEGEVDIVIGTHRLLSKDVAFKDVGLIIIDEEQRFGVRHKERLKALRTQAHVLTLSATPIPRTLYFSLSGLRDISTITTPPQGRQPIDTVIESFNSERATAAMRRELERGGQVFYLYNHVQTIHSAKKRVQAWLGDDVRVDIMHGQMPEDEMARVAEAFDHGKIDVLICTTIVENGLDIPNVNTLIVENATTFGLGQLYQIRGRIGRGKVKAYAHFYYPEEGLTGIAAKRLQILQEAKDLGSGFQLAMRDLEMRGMGQLIGKRQHGHIQSIGLNMYGRLLRQAVEKLESGQVQPTRSAVHISLPLDYGIPETLIAEPAQRVRAYRQLSQAETKEELDRAVQSYQEALSKLSEQDIERFNNLLKIIELRQLAAHTPLVSIDYQDLNTMAGKRQVLEFEFSEMKPGYIEKLIRVIPDFKIAGNKIIINAEEIRDFYTETKKILHIL